MITPVEQKPPTIKKSHSVLLIGAIGGLIGIVLTLLGYIAWQTVVVSDMTTSTADVTVPLDTDSLPVDESDEQASTTTERVLPENLKEDEMGMYIEDMEHKELIYVYDQSQIPVVWNDGPKERVESSDSTFLSRIEYFSCEEIFPDSWGYVDCTPYLYPVGSVSVNGTQEIVYTLAFKEEMMATVYFNRLYFIFPKGLNGSPIQLIDGDTEIFSFPDYVKRYTHDVDITLPEAPTHLSLNDESILIMRELEGDYFGMDDLSIGAYTDIPRGAKEVMAQGKKLYYADGAYYLRLSDGSIMLYEVMPSFFLSTIPEEADKYFYYRGFQPEVEWTKEGIDPEMSVDFSSDFMVSGCGMEEMVGTSLVSDESWFAESSLTPIALDGNGRSVLYEVKDDLRADHPYYRQFFEDVVILGRLPYDEQDTDNVFETDLYTEYLAGTPLIFWQNTDGGWQAYYNLEFQAAVECGKPVIYLYPEEAMDVNVQVAPNGGFTYVEPAYPQDGWTVHAETDGTLYNYADHTTYPYLYWEGHATGFGFSDRGWMLSSESMETELYDLMIEAGLNHTEATDFVEFWEPKMHEAPYTFVTFTSEPAFERAAPLTVTPAPDSVLRLFMYFEPRDTFEAVVPLPLRSFERNGFTVVEWGGMLAEYQK